MKTKNSYENLYWEKHDWRIGESITEEKMDNIENGVAIVASQVQDLIDSGGSGGGSSEPTVTIESIMYAVGANGTSPPDDNATWYTLEDFEGAQKGQWIWTRTTYSNGMKAYSVSYAGTDSEGGQSSLTTTFRYAVSNSGTAIPTTGWQSNYFAPQKGQWFWVETTYSTGSVSYSVSYVGNDATPLTIQTQPYHDDANKRTVVSLSDGTILYIPDGSDGPQGASGTNGYVHIAWADNIVVSQDGTVNATGFTTAGGEGKAWMGIYDDENSNDSANAADYTWTKIQIPGTSYYLLCEPNVLPHNFSGQRITLRAKKAEGTNDPINYSGYFRLLGFDANGEQIGEQKSTSSSSTTAKASYTFDNLETNFPNVAYFRGQLYSQSNYSGGLYLLDSQTIAIMESEDAYTVLLDNENHSFPGTTTAAVQGSDTTIQILAYKGTLRKAVTIGTISAPTGMGVTINSNGTTQANIVVRVNGTVSVPGTINIPFSVDGVSFEKIFSYSIAFTSENGSAPTSMVQQYARYTSSSSYSNIPSNRWSTTYPTDTSQGNYVWTRMQLIWEEGSPTYTTPVLETGISTAIDQIKDLDESLNKEGIFNRLTNNGQDQGIFIYENGDYYINGTYIRANSISADQIDATNLHVEAANIDGTLTLSDLSMPNYSDKLKINGNPNLFSGCSYQGDWIYNPNGIVIFKLENCEKYQGSEIKYSFISQENYNSYTEDYTSTEEPSIYYDDEEGITYEEETVEQTTFDRNFDYDEDNNYIVNMRYEIPDNASNTLSLFINCKHIKNLSVTLTGSSNIQIADRITLTKNGLRINNFTINKYGYIKTPYPLDIPYGGTGARTVIDARSNLDVYSKSEVNNLISSGGSSTSSNINFIITTTTKSDSLSLSSGNSLIANTINIIAIRGGTTGSSAITIAGKTVRKNYSTSLIAAIPANFMLEAYYDGSYLYALNLPATF